MHLKKQDGEILKMKIIKRGKILKDARTSSGTRTKEKIIELLDIAFSRKRDKDMILNVFKKNEWR